MIIEQMHSPIHPTLQVPLAQLPALVVVDPAVTAQASEVLFHDGLALGFVVEGKGAAFGRVGFGDDLAAAGAAEGGHFWLFWGCCSRVRRRRKK